MSGKVIEFMGQQKYRFDFGTDGKLYVVIFNAKIPQAELKKLLSSLGNSLYEKMPGAILLYLEQHQFEFSDYNSIEIPLENHSVMEWAVYLIHSDTYEKVDENLENADIYYAVMDYQDTTPDGGAGKDVILQSREQYVGMGASSTMPLSRLIFIMRETVMKMDILLSGRIKMASSTTLTA